MNSKKLQSIIVFICVMAAIAIIISIGQYRQEKQKEEIKQDADAKIASTVEHNAFKNQYVNANLTRTFGVPLVAVAVAAEDKTMNHAMSTVLISRFKGDHVQLVDSFFKPPLVSDGLFDDVFNGSSALFEKLEITNSVDALLLGRQSVQYSTNNALDGVITANMNLEVISLPVAGQFQSRSWTFIANGNGFRPAEARMQAEERIIKQISDEPDMSLDPINANH